MKKENLTYGELKKMYPIGTEFISPHSGKKFTVCEYYDPYKDDEYVYSVQVRDTFKNSIPYILEKGILGEIISLPEPKNEIIDNYEIY